MSIAELGETGESGSRRAGAHTMGYFDAVCEFEYLAIGSTVYGKRTPSEMLEDLGISGPSESEALPDLIQEYVAGYQSYVDELVGRLRGQLADMQESPAGNPNSTALSQDMASAAEYLERLQARLDHVQLWPGGVLASGGGLRRP
jgi:hypothetical protein